MGWLYPMQLVRSSLEAFKAVGRRIYITDILNSVTELKLTLVYFHEGTLQ